MWRVISLLAIMVALLAGCSRQPAGPETDPQKASAPLATKKSPSVDATDPSQSGAAAKQLSAEASQIDGPTEAGTANQTQADPEMYAQVLGWLEQVGSEASVERLAGSDALDQAGESAMPSVILALRDGSTTQKRGAAAYLIGRVSPRDETAGAELIECLSADDDALRHAALQAVEKLSDAQLIAAVDALARLAENTREEDAYRSRAVRAIAKLGADAVGVTDRLVELAESEDGGTVRRASFYAIAKVAPPQRSEAFFRAQLESADSADLRRLAAKWLAGLATSRDSLEQLVAAFGDSDQSVRLEAIDSLVAIGKPTLPVLIEASSSPDVPTRRHAVLAIGKLGLLARDAVPALQSRLNDPDQQVRDLAQQALDALK